MHNRSLSLIVTVFLATRLGVLGAGISAISAFGFDPTLIPAPVSRNALLDLPARWDSAWYVGVAARGYVWNAPASTFQNTAFFPAYPFLLRTVAVGLRVPHTPLHWTWVGVAISLCCFVVALAYLHRYTIVRLDDSSARWTVIFTSTYPFAVFFGLPYTEALFILCGVGACFHAYRGEFLKAAVWGLTAGLSRPNGMLVSLLLLPCAHDLTAEWRESRVRVLKRVCVVGSPILGVLCFSLYAYAQSGSLFAWATAQHSAGRVSVPFFTRMSDIYSQVSSLGLLQYSLQRPYDFLNACAGLLMIVLALPVGRLLGLGPGIYVVSSVLVPLAVGGLPSLGRYTSVLFPAHIFLANKLSENGRIFLCIVFSIGQALIAAMFFTWRPMY